MVPSRIECLHNATLLATSPSPVTSLTRALARGPLASPTSTTAASANVAHLRRAPIDARRATITMRPLSPRSSVRVARRLHVRRASNDEALTSTERDDSNSLRVVDVRHVENLTLCFTSAGDVM